MRARKLSAASRVHGGPSGGGKNSGGRCKAHEVNFWLAIAAGQGLGRGAIGVEIRSASGQKGESAGI